MFTYFKEENVYMYYKNKKYKLNTKTLLILPLYILKIVDVALETKFN